MRPNVLIFCVDEMRADHLGCMGNRVVRTPNLDALSRRGTLFHRSFCNNPICMPARATMFTGLLPRDHGLRVNGQTMHSGLPLLPELLSRAGYRTHSAGKLHLTPWVPKASDREASHYPESLDFWDRGLVHSMPTPYAGFQSIDFVGGHTSFIFGDYIRWLEARGGCRDGLRPSPDRMLPHGRAYRMGVPEALHYNRYIADSTIGVIESSAADADRPFFCWCSFPDPHDPVAAPDRFLAMYDSADIAPPACEEGELTRLPPVYRRIRSGELRPNGVDNRPVTDEARREFIAGTHAMVSHVDTEIGRVLEALERTGQARNTLIVFLGDHGDMMGDHGLTAKAFYTFRGCIRIPTIVVAPGARSGRVSDALIAQIDLLPSVLDYCGIALPGSEWSSQQTPFERGSVRPLRLYPGCSWRPLVEGDTDRIRDEVVIENDDPTTGYQARCLVTDRHRLAVYPGTEHGELFDLVEDPREMRNLWDEAADLRQALTTRLLHAYSLNTPFYPVPPWNS